MDVWQTTLRRLLGSPSPDRDRRHSEEDYELLSGDPPSSRGPILPNGSHHTHHHRSPSFRNTSYSPRALLFGCVQKCSLRRVLIAFAMFPMLLVVAILWSGVPPSYEDIRAFERRLPQHNLSLAAPEGEGGSYLRFPGHLWGHGLNNILQET